MTNIILETDDLRSLSVDPAKTIFWVGAGVGCLTPCNLPLGNDLTDAILQTALGEENKDKLIDLWNNEIENIRGSVQNNELLPLKKQHGDRKRTGRPRLEFIIGEMHKLDVEFRDIHFQKESNRTTYQRGSTVKTLQHFADAAPNVYHYALADFARAGAMMVTTNFDTCIEKALGLKDSELRVTDQDGIKAVKYAGGRYVYHVHGVATDEHIETNLGATLTNVSKSMPKRFRDKLCKCFEEGYTIVFIGYGGVDFFDVKPFFDSLRDRAFPGKAIYLHYCRNEECKNNVPTVKNYQYLLMPFQEQIICYGVTETFQEALAARSGVAKTVHTLPTTKGKAFENTQKAFSDNLVSYTADAREKYQFINMFRLASQLNIGMRRFYPDWPGRLAAIYGDWKDDAPNSETLYRMVLEPEDITRCIVDDIKNNNCYSREPVYTGINKDILQIFKERKKTFYAEELNPLENVPEELLRDYVNRTCRILDTEDNSGTAISVQTATVLYLCGYNTHKLCREWIFKPFHRKRIEGQLRVLLGYIDQLLQYPYNHFLYMTFYLSLNRRKHIINAILGRQNRHSHDKTDYDRQDDEYNVQTGCYGNIQAEWNICMETPNFYDAGKIVRGMLFQYICMLARGKMFHPLRVWRLYKIERNIVRLRK